MENKPATVYLSNLKPIGSTTGLKGRIYEDKVDEHWQTDDKGRKYLPYTIWENKAPDQYGNTHFMKLDLWKPEAKTDATTVKKTQPNLSDLPF